MRWAAAIEQMLALAGSDQEIQGALGGNHVYRHGEHSEYRIPGVYYQVVWSGAEEVMEPVLTQWDIYARDLGTLLLVERRLRRLFHWPGWRTLGDVSLSSIYVDSRDHPEPDVDVVHRSLDFRHTPVRNRGW